MLTAVNSLLRHPIIMPETNICTHAVNRLGFSVLCLCSVFFAVTGCGTFFYGLHRCNQAGGLSFDVDDCTEGRVIDVAIFTLAGVALCSTSMMCATCAFDAQNHGEEPLLDEEEAPPHLQEFDISTML